MIPTDRFLSLNDDLGKTLSDSLLVVADVVDGGGDFPIQRATNVEEKKKQKRHHHNTEHNP